MVGEAFRTALAPRQGPVALNLPRDLLAEPIDVVLPLRATAADAGAVAAGDPAALRRCATLLANAAKPLIIAGGGIKNSRAHEAVLRLAEILHAPVVTAEGDGDAVPCEHPLYGGQVGPRGNSVASDMARAADVILALGTRLGFNTTFYSYDNLNPAAKIIQVEIEPTALGRFFPVEIAVHGGAGSVAAQLADELANHQAQAALAWETDFHRKRQKLLAERDTAGSQPAQPIQPAALFKALRDCTPDDAMFTMDAGTLCLQATDQLRYCRPPSLFTPLDFGLVGFSYACGLGVKLACPERPVISLMGDGGFGMTLSEIGTAVSHGINTVCVVMNNGCWGAEKSYQRDFFGERYIGADVPNPPYDRVAELYDAAGFRVERTADMSDALAAALACGKPAIIDVMVDPDALYSFRRDSFQHRAAAAK
jgi:acetolactate synthase-1/2/3 large subunit/sulfoacetaldehyde acetyltransferase